MPDTDRISPAGKKQQNAAKKPYATPKKDPALQPDDWGVRHTMEDERRFYEEYLSRTNPQNTDRDRVQREQT